MKVVFEPEAIETIYEVADFIDTINVPGAGNIWATYFIETIKSFAKPHIKYGLCNNQILADFGLSCIIINGWVVAFKMEEGILHVYHVIRGNVLN